MEKWPNSLFPHQTREKLFLSLQVTPAPPATERNSVNFCSIVNRCGERLSQEEEAENTALNPLAAPLIRRDTAEAWSHESVHKEREAGLICTIFIKLNFPETENKVQVATRTKPEENKPEASTLKLKKYQLHLYKSFGAKSKHIQSQSPPHRLWGTDLRIFCFLSILILSPQIALQ